TVPSSVRASNRSPSSVTVTVEALGALLSLMAPIVAAARREDNSARRSSHDPRRGQFTTGRTGSRWDTGTVVQDSPSRSGDPEHPEPRRDDLTTEEAPPGTARATSRNPYRDVLSLPGAWRFSAAALVARLPMSMVGIGTILMIQGIYGQYALAGRVAAALVVAQAIVSPQIARLVDRTGQRAVMLPML